MNMRAGYPHAIFLAGRLNSRLFTILSSDDNWIRVGTAPLQMEGTFVTALGERNDIAWPGLCERQCQGVIGIHFHDMRRQRLARFGPRPRINRSRRAPPVRI